MITREKMATLGTLTAGIAHELNNPNNFVFGGARNLQRKLNEFKGFLLELAEGADKEVLAVFEEYFEKMDSHLECIDNGANRIAEIIKDLRLVTRLDESEEKTIDILEGLNAALALISTQFDDVSYHVNAPEPLILPCRPAELNQVFISLITNGFQAMSGAEEKSEKRLLIRAYNEENYAIVEFEDSGTGIGEEDLDKIFDAFFTTRPVGSGMGLGLFTSYKIIEKHQGMIEVTSSVGKGSLFRVRLPL